MVKPPPPRGRDGEGASSLILPGDRVVVTSASVVITTVAALVLVPVDVLVLKLSIIFFSYVTPPKGEMEEPFGKNLFFSRRNFYRLVWEKFFALHFDTARLVQARGESRNFSCYPERSRGSRWIFKSTAKVRQFIGGVK